MHSVARREGEAQQTSAPGPIRRIPSQTDTRLHQSGSQGTYSGHYTPYGSVFAAAAVQQAALASADEAAVSGDAEAQLQQQQQLKASRKPPLRHHSFDSKHVKQSTTSSWQPPRGCSGVSTCQPAMHSLDCGCDECARPGGQQQLQVQQRMAYQFHMQKQHHQLLQQQEQGLMLASASAACGCPGGVDMAQGSGSHHVQYRLGYMHSGPPAFRSEGDMHSAGGGGAAGGEGSAGHASTQQQCDVGGSAGPHAGPPGGIRFHSFNCLPHGLQRQAQEHELRAHMQFAEAAAAAAWHHQQQQAAACQQQHQQRTEEGTNGLSSMFSAPACTHLQHEQGQGVVAAATAASGATAAALVGLHQVPAGLAAIRLRPQAPCITHTVRGDAHPAAAHTIGLHLGDDHGHEQAAAAAAARAARAAAAAADGRDMVSTTHLHQHLQQQNRSVAAAAAAAAGPRTQQPTMRQQDLQRLLQHQLRHLVSGTAAAAAEVRSSVTGAAAQHQQHHHQQQQGVQVNNGCAADEHQEGGTTCQQSQQPHINLQDPGTILELLRHSGMCKLSDEVCALGCRCTWVKRLWIHMHGCRTDAAACNSGHCRMAKQVLAHYKECCDVSCSTCSRVRSLDQALEELRALSARAASMTGESVDSPTNDDDDRTTTPSSVYIAGEEVVGKRAAAAGGNRRRGNTTAAAAAAAAAVMSPALSVNSKAAGAAARRREHDGSRRLSEEEVEQVVYRRHRLYM